MNQLERPTLEEAHSFAVMIDAGLPEEQAIRYFYEAADPAEIKAELARWLRSTRVRRAQADLQGKSWQDMTLEERIDTGLTRHYNGLAWFLYARNYSDANQTEKAKLDTARSALEAKRAGQAGAADPLSRFFEDLKAGRLQLQQSGPAPVVRTPNGVLQES